MNGRITRRKLAMAALCVAPAAAGQASAGGADNPQSLLETARRQMERNRETLKQFRLSQTVEPAFLFRS